MVYAQGVGASGDIRGTVTDPSGAVVTNANVTATDLAKGIKHTVATDSNGNSPDRAAAGNLQPKRVEIRFSIGTAKNVVVKRRPDLDG